MNTCAASLGEGAPDGAGSALTGQGADF